MKPARSCDELKRRRWRRWWPWIAVGSLLAAYVIGYFNLGDMGQQHDWISRNYPSPFVARLFIPLGVIETVIDGRPVGIQSIQKDSDFEWNCDEHWPLLDRPPAVRDLK